MAAKIELNPDVEQRRRIMDFIMAVGRTLLENGAEVFRVEQTMEIMAASFHLREFHVYVLTNGIFASAGTAEISEVRNVPNRTVHLARVAAVNALSRDIAAGRLSLDEAEHRLAEVHKIPEPTMKEQVLASAAGAFCFCLLFGGNLPEGGAAAMAGAALGWYLVVCGRHGVVGMFRRLTGAALLSAVCLACAAFVPGIGPSSAISGALMILTPGVAFTMGIRDFVRADYLSGTIRMIDALLVAGSIACGTGLVVGLYSWFVGVAI